MAAARTLGYIGYIDGAAALIEQLANESDWRMVLVSAESLGRLGAFGAIPTLTHVAEVHWYPPVREAAKKALRVISGEDAYRSRWRRQNFAVEFFDYEFLGNQQSRSTEAAPMMRGEGELDSGELRTLSYGHEQRYLGPDGLGIVERRTSSPEYGLSVPGGFLLGSDRGEWGGELVFQTHGGVTTGILERTSIVGIHSMPFGIVAITDSGLGEGMLYLVDISPKEPAAAHRWRVLPSSPHGSGFRPDGSLEIDCAGGDVMVTPGGDLRMVH